MNDNPVIDPQNLPTWVAASFICALLALVLAMVGIYRTHLALSVTQAQVIALTGKLAELEKKTPPTGARPANPAGQ